MYPLLPGVYFSFQKARNVVFRNTSHILDNEKSLKVNSRQNRLVIPVIGVDALIVEGTTNDALDRGVWHRPKTGIPGTKTNTVFTGHRFLYTGFSKNTFYNLDKLRVGDELIVFWAGNKFYYKIVKRHIVSPKNIEIEGDFKDERVTLYTCHPLWTADKRLVLVAKPM